jgi:hypothetical protein
MFTQEHLCYSNDRNNGNGSGGNRVEDRGRVDGGGCSWDQRGGLPRMKLDTVLATSGSGEKSPYGKCSFSHGSKCLLRNTCAIRNACFFCPLVSFVI